MQPHDEPLLDQVFNRLAGDDVPEQTATLVLAAYAGDGQLRAALAGDDPGLPAPGDDSQARIDPVYLESVTLAGFRGVGPQASLRLLPSPGLTLVVGRNGSGKSSFAEAVELCLTGNSPRWSEQSSVFREGWRNLHQASPCQVRVTLRADGEASPVQVTRTWRDSDTQPEQATISVVAGGKRHQDVGELGWAAALETYRPFLTAGDFGRLISSRPSTLFDALAPILGLDPLTEADKRLMNARKEISDRLKRLKADRDGLRTILAGVGDDRARAADAILAKRQPDLAALDQMLASADAATASPVAAACRRLADAGMPGPPDMAGLAERMDAAAAEVTAAAASDSRAAQQVADLLEAALAFHADHGDGPCPVCQTGTLDPVWRAQATHALASRQGEAARARSASQRRADTVSQARSLRAAQGWPAMADATSAAPALGQPAADLARLLGEWQDLLQDAAPERLPEHLRVAYPALHAAFLAAREEAADWLRRRHDAWREPAAALQAWLASARRLAGDDVLLTRIGAAREWLKTATEEIRGDRLAPFAQRSQEVWEQLRQESNVELSGMRLDGSSTRRRVVFPATVDGTPAQALAVMSHGELQALGLAVFLPRACADDSPFRYLIVDDPVHSMDPSKVDGLAQVLASLAATRQVIVFTHDNRLPEAIRRLEIDATIWEVARREGSVVELRKNLDPVTRYLDDARALAVTADLPDEVRRPVVAGFCRSAIEAACHERVRRERLGRGERVAEVDALLESARTLTQTMALALFGDMSRGGDVLAGLNHRFGHWAGDVFQACQRAVHGGTGASLRQLVNDTDRLAGGLR